MSWTAVILTHPIKWKLPSPLRSLLARLPLTKAPRRRIDTLHRYGGGEGTKDGGGRREEEARAASTQIQWVGCPVELRRVLLVVDREKHTTIVTTTIKEGKGGGIEGGRGGVWWRAG